MPEANSEPDSDTCAAHPNSSSHSSWSPSSRLFALEFPVTLPLLAKFTFHGGARSLRCHVRAHGRWRDPRTLVVASRRRPTGRSLVIVASRSASRSLGAAGRPHPDRRPRRDGPPRRSRVRVHRLRATSPCSSPLVMKCAGVSWHSGSSLPSAPPPSVHQSSAGLATTSDRATASQSAESPPFSPAHRVPLPRPPTHSTREHTHRSSHDSCGRPRCCAPSRTPSSNDDADERIRTGLIHETPPKAGQAVAACHPASARTSQVGLSQTLHPTPKPIRLSCNPTGFTGSGGPAPSFASKGQW